MSSIYLHDELIKTQSKTHDLDYHLVYSIIEVESAGNTYAMRYEPHWSYLWFPRERASLLKITDDTEIQLQKFSYGLGQVMGSVARQHGFEKMLPILLQPEIGLKYMCVHLAYLRSRCESESDLIASYNGGWGILKKEKSGHYKNQTYVDKVSSRLRDLRKLI